MEFWMYETGQQLGIYKIIAVKPLNNHCHIFQHIVQHSPSLLWNDIECHTRARTVNAAG